MRLFRVYEKKHLSLSLSLSFRRKEKTSTKDDCPFLLLVSFDDAPIMYGVPYSIVFECSRRRNLNQKCLEYRIDKITVKCSLFSQKVIL